MLLTNICDELSIKRRSVDVILVSVNVKESPALNQVCFFMLMQSVDDQFVFCCYLVL